VVPAPAHFIVVGHKTPTVFFTKMDTATKLSSVFAANVDTGETRKLVTLPERAGVASVNADETLAAGTYIEGNAEADYNRQVQQQAKGDGNAADRGGAGMSSRCTSTR